MKTFLNVLLSVLVIFIMIAVILLAFHSGSEGLLLGALVLISKFIVGYCIGDRFAELYFKLRAK